MEDIFGFYVVDSHPNVLLGWVVGELAHKVEELPDNMIMKGCVFLIRKFLKNIYLITSPDKIIW